MNCYQCEKNLDASWRSCPYCGTVVPPIVSCANCGRALESSWTVCPHCQTPVAIDDKRSPSQSLQDVTAREVTQAGTISSHTGDIHYHGVPPSFQPESQPATSGRDYCGVCHRSLPDDHFKCPECSNLACIECRSLGRNCLNCAPTAPGPPLNLLARLDGEIISLTWDPPSSDGGADITQYTVRYSVDQKVAAVVGNVFGAHVELPGDDQDLNFIVSGSNRVSEGPASVESSVPAQKQWRSRFSRLERQLSDLGKEAARASENAVRKSSELLAEATDRVSEFVADVTHFDQDDEGYRDWIASHPEGYVVNSETTPRAGYLKLHSSTCRWVSDSSSAYTTGSYSKTCAEAIELLDLWAENVTGGALDPCGVCKPLRKQ